jgi:hypothetical protein
MKITAEKIAAEKSCYEKRVIKNYYITSAPM